MVGAGVALSAAWMVEKLVSFGSQVPTAYLVAATVWWVPKVSTNNANKVTMRDMARILLMRSEMYAGITLHLRSRAAAIVHQSATASVVRRFSAGGGGATWNDGGWQRAKR
jgi:hypothetical protein